MVIDSSALIAILLKESERDGLQRAIKGSASCLVSAVTKLEASMVMAGRFGAAGAAELDALLHEVQAQVVPFDERLADLARDAFVRFGKGRHPAGLNFGDCAAYALAISEAEPLLFKGADFSQTDVEVVQLQNE